MAKLILVRHGQSTYNEKGLWAGFIDCPLTDLGREEARAAGEALKDVHIDTVFVSDLLRAQQTWEEMAKVLGCKDIKPIIAPEIKERNYGDLAGKNKWEMKEQYGEEQWMKWRRGWNDDVPGGETLEDVYNRVVPYYQQTILPLLKEGKTVLLSAHGNSLRALVKYLDDISDEDIPKLEIATGGIYVYTISEADGSIAGKEQRAAVENKA